MNDPKVLLFQPTRVKLSLVHNFICNRTFTFRSLISRSSKEVLSTEMGWNISVKKWLLNDVFNEKTFWDVWDWLWTGTSTSRRATTTPTTTQFHLTLPRLDENRWVILETRKRSLCFTPKLSRTELSRIIFGTRPSPIFLFASPRPRPRRPHRRWCRMILRPRWGRGILWGFKFANNIICGKVNRK